MLGQPLTVLLAESVSHSLCWLYHDPLLHPSPSQLAVPISFCHRVPFHWYIVLWVAPLFPNRCSSQEEPCSGSGRQIKPPCFPRPPPCSRCMWHGLGGMVTIRVLNGKWGERASFIPSMVPNSIRQVKCRQPSHDHPCLHTHVKQGYHCMQGMWQPRRPRTGRRRELNWGTYIFSTALRSNNLYPQTLGHFRGHFIPYNLLTDY